MVVYAVLSGMVVAFLAGSTSRVCTAGQRQRFCVLFSCFFLPCALFLLFRMHHAYYCVVHVCVMRVVDWNTAHH